MPVFSSTTITRIRSNLAPGLLLVSLFLFISKSLYNVPMGIMAVMGAWYSFKYGKRLLRDPFTRSYILMFFCLWLPMLISLTDAVNPHRSAETVFSYLRFLFLGIYVLYEIRTPAVLAKIQATVFILVSFWCIDAIIQLLFGMDLFGYPYRAGDITGMFYPRNTIAHVTASLCPYFFEAIRRRSDRLPWLWLLLLPLFLVILFSGRRAAWIMLAVGCTGYVYYLVRLSGSYAYVRKRIIPLAAIIAIVCITALASSQQLRNRVDITMELFSANYQKIDAATAMRLPIWNTAVSMFKDNWINGVGARGFRYAYRRYSAPDDYWVKLGSALPTTQPHQIILEILAETGVLGMLGFTLSVYVLFRMVRDKNLLMPCYPALLAVFIAVFPFNTNMAFFSSYWSSVIWWLVLMVFLTGSITTNPGRGAGRDT